MNNEEYNNQEFYTNPQSDFNYTENPYNPDPQPPKKKKRGKVFTKIIAFALVFGVAAGGTFYAADYIENRSENKEQETIKTEQIHMSEADKMLTTNPVTTTSVNDVSGVVQEVMPSIVAINVSAIVNESDFFGQEIQQQKQGSGSGIIIAQNNSQVLVVTNNHVVSGATLVQVEFVDGKTAEATVKGTDSSNDLAVVAIELSDLEQSTKDAIRIATLGDSTKVKPGEMVVAIGNALGYGQSVTVGYISALNREVQTEDYTMKLLQTDAAINPGNSGGALLNASGQVIGINSVKYASTKVESMGYAIPISDALPIIKDLMTREIIPEDEQAYLGIYGQEITEATSNRFGYPIGIYVGEITKGSPAARYGLQVRDVIVGINDKKIATMKDLQETLSSKRAGTKVTITVKRQHGDTYAEKDLTVTLGKKPLEANRK